MTFDGTLDYQAPNWTACAAPMPQWQSIAAPCDRCGWSHTSAQCVVSRAPRLSENDVDRIAKRVVELLEAKK